MLRRIGAGGSTIGLVGAQPMFDELGERGDRGLREDAGGLKIDVEHPRESIGDLDQRQRMPSEIEEILVNAGARPPQHGGPDLRHHAFHRRVRLKRPDAAQPGEAALLGLTLPHGVSGSVSSTTRSAGTMCSGSNSRSLWRTASDSGADRLAGTTHATRSGPSGRQLRIDDGVSDTAIAQKRRFDFTRLGAEPAQRLRPIGATHMLNGTSRQRSAKIAGLVQPATTGAEGIRDEPIRGLVGPIPVAARRIQTSDVNLPDAADRHRLQIVVQYVQSEIADGEADGG